MVLATGLHRPGTAPSAPVRRVPETFTDDGGPDGARPPKTVILCLPPEAVRSRTLTGFHRNHRLWSNRDGCTCLTASSSAAGGVVLLCARLVGPSIVARLPARFFRELALGRVDWSWRNGAVQAVCNWN